jgi:hypothetical protein
MPAYNVSGPKGREEMDYGIVAASSPIQALQLVHADGLGPGRVRVEGDRLLFSSAEDQRTCAGIWRVVELAGNGGKSSVEISIPSP